jgi:hypothetical protein
VRRFRRLKAARRQDTASPDSGQAQPLCGRLPGGGCRGSVRRPAAPTVPVAATRKPVTPHCIPPSGCPHELSAYGAWAAGAGFSVACFSVSDCLTVAEAGTYIAFTEGGSLVWGGRLCRLQRKLRARPGLWPWDLVSGVCVGSLTLLMEEREAQAAGPCGSGGLAPSGAQAVRTKERWLCFKRATRFGLVSGLRARRLDRRAG